MVMMMYGGGDVWCIVGVMYGGDDVLGGGGGDV